MTLTLVQVKRFNDLVFDSSIMSGSFFETSVLHVVYG